MLYCYIAILLCCSIALLFYCVLCEVDAPHSESGATMLMACVVRGWNAHVERLLMMGADPLRAFANGVSPLHLAAQLHPSLLLLIQTHMYARFDCSN